MHSAGKSEVSHVAGSQSPMEHAHNLLYNQDTLMAGDAHMVINSPFVSLNIAVVRTQVVENSGGNVPGTAVAWYLPCCLHTWRRRLSLLDSADYAA